MASEREAEAWGWGLTVGPAEESGAGGGGGGAFVRGCGAGVGVCVVVVGGRGPLGPLGYWRAAAPAAFDPEAPMISECVGSGRLEVFVVEGTSQSRCVLCRKVDDDDDGLMLNARPKSSRNHEVILGFCCCRSFKLKGQHHICHETSMSTAVEYCLSIVMIRRFHPGIRTTMQHIDARYKSTANFGAKLPPSPSLMIITTMLLSLV